MLLWLILGCSDVEQGAEQAETAQKSSQGEKISAGTKGNTTSQPSKRPPNGAIGPNGQVIHQGHGPGPAGKGGWTTRYGWYEA